MDLAATIRDIPDFPKEGILFKDITTLLLNGAALKEAVDSIASSYEGRQDIKAVVGCEARGFIFGTAVAYKLGIGFIPVRKPGKLPAKTEQVTYELEYGTDSLEIHADAIAEGDNILIVDDLLATGGTAKATAQLIEKLGGKICGISFLIELEFLSGRDQLKDYPVSSIIKY